MGVGPGLYMYDVVVKRSRSLSHLLMSSCRILVSTSILSVVFTYYVRKFVFFDALLTFTFVMLQAGRCQITFPLQIPLLRCGLSSKFFDHRCMVAVCH